MFPILKSLQIVICKNSYFTVYTKVSAELHSVHRPQFSGLFCGVFSTLRSSYSQHPLGIALEGRNMNASDRNQYSVQETIKTVGKGCGDRNTGN